MSKLNELPAGWAHAQFEEAVDLISDRGFRIKQKNYLSSGRTPVVDQGEGLIGGYSNDTEARIETPLPAIVFGDHTRRFKFVSFPFAVGADGVKLFHPVMIFDPKFLFYQLGTVGLEDRGYGRHYQHLRKETLVLPPFQEQTRIVAKLEELLSDLDAGVAELKAGQKKLAQYRQSLLKAAVEGALTAEWRAKRVKLPSPAGGRGAGGEGESGAQLLAHILSERRSRWEARQLAKFQGQGKTPPKGWQDKYPVPVRPDTTDLPPLPEGWVWASLDQLTEFITSGSRGWADYYSLEGALFIRSQNINKDWLDLSDIAFVNPPQSSEGARTLVKTDDLLLTITGANVGKVAHVDMVPSETYVSQHVALIRPVEITLSRYLYLYLIAGAGGRGHLNKEAYGAGKPGLNLQQVASVAVPLPCLQEIMSLLGCLTTQFEALAIQQKAIEISLKQATAQRQNIFKTAFSGQLVAQDPSDEPASRLLEHIRAERASRAESSGKVRRIGRIKHA